MIDVGKPTQCMICPPDAAGTCNRNHNRTERQPSILLEPIIEEVVEYNYPEQLPTFQEQLPTFQEQLPTFQEQLPTFQEQLPTFQEQPLGEDEEDDEEEEYNGPAGIPVHIVLILAVALVAAAVLAFIIGVTFSDNLQIVNLLQFQPEYVPTE